MNYRHLIRMLLLLSGLILALILMACGSATPIPTLPPTSTAKPTSITSPTPSGVTKIPMLTGLTEVVSDPTIKRGLATNLPGKTSSDLSLYASDDSPDSAANKAHSSLLKVGYIFSIPGQTSPVEQDDGNFVGLYTKPGLPDVMMVSVIAPADGDGRAIYDEISSWSGVSPEAARKFADQLDSKQALVILIVAPGLVQNMLSSAD